MQLQLRVTTSLHTHAVAEIARTFLTAPTNTYQVHGAQQLV